VGMGIRHVYGEIAPLTGREKGKVEAFSTEAVLRRDRTSLIILQFNVFTPA
jgi:hypothetical protein